MNPQIVTVPDVSSILVIAAHPDDLESGCGGVLARAIDAGATVRILLATSGDKGSSDPEVIPAELAIRREAEAIRAAEILGAETIEFLRYPDGELEANQDLLERIVRSIRTWKPDVIFTFDPDHALPKYVAHRDHRVIGRVTLDAVYPAARDPHNFPQHRAEGLSTHKVRQVWLFWSACADRYVDITAGFERKVAARLAHVSQTPDPEALPIAWRKRAADLGEPVGLEMAEVFTIVDLLP